MNMKVLQTILVSFVVCTLAFEDFIYVYGEGNKEMSEQGRVQYQIIKERGVLPRYGSCWKSALEHLNEGCRFLSEDTQSDMALHITNCFLEMSGHETYNCELDKKPNLRSICISSMTDRAFNVYTEFYTHTQNICWFLRGQIWHETIAENTLKVGKQLEVSTNQQKKLIEAQKESIILQEKMVRQGKYLEEVLQDVYVSTKAHQEVLKLLTQSVTSLQSWIVGEISWIDSIIFNVVALFLIFILTSSQRTASARLPLFFLLFMNLLTERLICSLFTKFHEEYDTKNLYSNLYSFVWYSRYAFTFLGTVVILYSIIMYKDTLEYNMSLLNTIQKQNTKILSSMEKLEHGKRDFGASSNVDFISESDNVSKTSSMDSNYKQFYYNKDCLLSKNLEMDFKESNGYHSNFVRRQLDSHKKYNLRSASRQGTPDSGVAH